MATQQKKSSGSAEFLKNLPSFKKENFSRFVADSSSRMAKQSNRTETRVICGDDSSSQVIVTEKTSILLRYLHDHWDRKNSTRKRTGRRENDETETLSALQDDDAETSGPIQNGQPARKMPRTL